LTGNQRHKNDITFGQRESRQSLLPLMCFNFPPTTQNLLKFYASRTNGTFGFTRHTSRHFAKQKEPFFATALMERVINDIGIFK